MKNNKISFQLSTSFEHTTQFAVAIPSGFIRDDVKNFFHGSSDAEIVLHPQVYYSLSILQKLTSCLDVIIIITFISATYTGIIGYRNLSQTVLLTCTTFFTFIFSVFAVNLDISFIHDQHSYLHYLLDSAILLLAVGCANWLVKLSVNLGWSLMVMTTVYLCGMNVLRLGLDVMMLFTPFVSV